MSRGTLDQSLRSSSFAYGTVTLSGGPFQVSSAEIPPRSRLCPQPQRTCPLVWALSLSLAATWEIDVSFSSSGYLDVSVPRVSLRYAMYSHNGTWFLRQVGFPIRTSQDQRLFAAPLSFSQLATSFIGFRCQGIRPMLLLA